MNLDEARNALAKSHLVDNLPPYAPVSDDTNLSLKKLENKKVRLRNVKTGAVTEFPYGQPGYPIPQVLWFLEQCGLAEVFEDAKPAEAKKPREIEWRIDRPTGIIRRFFIVASCTWCRSKDNVEIMNPSQAASITFKCQCAKERVPIPDRILDELRAMSV
jgi:hypothetical protein